MRAWLRDGAFIGGPDWVLTPIGLIDLDQSVPRAELIGVFPIGNAQAYRLDTRNLCAPVREHVAMDKDRIAGSAKVMKGAVKEAVGKVTGDAKLESEGKADKVAGKIQNAIGGAKDAVKDALKK